MKILVIGNSGVGKTSVLKRLIYKNFSETYKATIGVDFGFYKVTLELTSNRFYTLVLFVIFNVFNYPYSAFIYYI